MITFAQTQIPLLYLICLVDRISFSTIAFIIWNSCVCKFVLLMLNVVILVCKWFICMFCYMPMYFIVFYVVYIFFIKKSIMPIINSVCEINQIFLNEQTPRIGGEYTQDVHFSNKSCLRVIIWENLKWHFLFVQHQKTAIIPENWIGLSILFPLAFDIKEYMLLSLHICRIWTTKKTFFIVKWMVFAEMLEKICRETPVASLWH